MAPAPRATEPRARDRPYLLVPPAPPTPMQGIPRSRVLAPVITSMCGTGPTISVSGRQNGNPRKFDRPEMRADHAVEVVSVLPRREATTRQGDETMIIEAIAKFACAHRYIAEIPSIGRPEAGDAGDMDRLLLVCERCGHRAEQLPLPRDTSFGRVIAFPSGRPAPDSWQRRPIVTPSPRPFCRRRRDGRGRISHRISPWRRAHTPRRLRHLARSCQRVRRDGESQGWQRFEARITTHRRFRRGLRRPPRDASRREERRLTRISLSTSTRRFRSRLETSHAKLSTLRHTTSGQKSATALMGTQL